MSMPPGWSNEFELSDAVLSPSGYRGGIGIGMLNGRLFNLDNEINHLRAYNECPPLKSIVSKRAKAFNVGKIDVINTNTGKPATGPEAAAYRKILKRPNPLQTQKQFFSQHNTYLDIFGYCPIFIVRPFGVNDAVSAIWNIPPWLFNIQFTGSWLQQNHVDGIFSGYTMNWSTGIVTLLKENLKLIFDDGFGTDMDINLCIPDSRLRSQEYPISNIVAALKGTNSLIVNKGPTGILTNGAKDTVGNIPLPDGEKSAIQKDFKRYGIVGQEFQVIITEANLSYQAIGSTMDQMKFPETIQGSVNMLCDAYGYYPELLARSQDTTFANKEKAEKMLYTGTIIPEDESRKEQLTDALIGNNSNLIIVSSFVHAPALQAERLETAQATKEMATAQEKLFKNNVITLNMWLEAQELPARTDGNGDKYYNELIDMGWQFGNTTVAGGDTQPTTAQQPKAA